MRFCELRIKNISFRYNLNLIKLPGPIQTALTTLKDLDPCVEGILMGTRYSDPHTGDIAFCNQLLVIKLIQNH